MDVSGKVLDFGLVRVDDGRMRPLQLWNELGNIVYLCVVKDTRSHFLKIRQLGMLECTQSLTRIPRGLYPL